MTNKDLANVIFPNITKTIEDYEKEYPKRDLPEGACVTRFAPSPTGFMHIGHFMPLMIMSYFQKHGHRPILLMGGGTALIGDPSGKTDMRKMLTREDIQNNVEKIKQQVSKFVSFEGENASIIVNNADWILNLNYMDFIRTYGVHFNVNKML